MADRQWEELDGDAALVAAKGAAYQQIAAAISRSTTTLQAITDEIDQKSLAMDAVRRLAGAVREDIQKAQERYGATGTALAAYGYRLAEAKAEADPAAAQLRVLRDELEAARYTARRAESEVADLPADSLPADVDDAHRAARSAGAAVRSLQGEIAVRENQWTRGHEAKEAAAATAVSEIREVVTGARNGGLEDSGWDVFGEVWDNVKSAVKAVCDVAGILAIFFSWVPIIGQVLVVLAAVGALLSVLDAVIAMAKGEGTFLDVLAAVGWAALSLVGGKLIGAGAKFVKARSLTKAAASMGKKVARARFGRAVMRDAYRTMDGGKGKLAWNALKSPFVRSSKAKDALAAYQRSRTGNNFARQLSNATKDAFPHRYLDSAGRKVLVPRSADGWLDVVRRAAYKSDDVADSHALKAAGTYKGASQYVFEGADRLAINAIRVSAVGVNVANVWHAQAAATDGWGRVTSAVKVADGVAPGLGVIGKASSMSSNVVAAVGGGH